MPRGRTRTFDTNEKLEQALDLFARQGYEATSIAQLTETLGLTPPQLYRAFGDKRHLFESALQLYGEHRRSDLDAVSTAPTVREAARRWLEGAAEHDTRAGHPRGCLTVQGCLAGSQEDRDIIETLARARDANQAVLKRRLDQGLTDGDLPTGTDTAAMARYLSTVSQGIAVQASGGASYEELRAVADIALRAIPGSTGHAAGSAVV